MITATKDLINEYGNNLVRAIANMNGVKLEYIANTFGDDGENYEGSYNNELEFATRLFADLYLHEIPEYLQSYIDYDQFCHDLFLSGDYASIEVEQTSSWNPEFMITMTHIFRSN